MFDVTATDIPASALLGAFGPKTIAGLYLDAVDAYEFIKSEDSKGMARASMGGALQALEAELGRRGLEYSDIEVSDEGHPTGAKLDALQTAWFESKRGW